MIRTLRPARSLPSLRSIPANSSPSRGLASRVLLNQVPLERLKVVQLKQHLRERQLSTTGVKATLITRLKQAGVESVAPEVPPMPTTTVFKAAVRHASTQAPKAKEPAQEEEPSIIATDASNVSSTKVAEVELPSAEEMAATTTEAPGLPENPFDGAKTSLDIQLPDDVPETETATPIPTILSYKGTTYPPTEKDASSPDQAFTPKVSTASSPSDSSGPSAPGSTGPSESSSSDEVSKIEDRPLSEQERKGAWTLFGILVGSFLVGGIGKDKKSVKETVETAKAKGKEAKGKAEELVEEGKKKAGELKEKAEGLVGEGKKKVEDVKSKGKELAGEAKSKGKEVVDEGKKKVDEAKGKGKEVVEEGKKKVEEVKGKGKEVVEEGKKKVDEAKDKGKEVVEKGKKKAEDVKETVKEKTK